MPPEPATPLKPLRLLIVLPSWVGDVAMATPTLKLIRESLPGCFIGALARPGIDALLHQTPLIDEFHVERSRGVFGPKFIAAKIRPRQYDTALLFTNSFSTALITRIAGIPKRIGYDRDVRGLLLTHTLKAPTDAAGKFRPVPACDYYFALANTYLPLPCPRTQSTLPPHRYLELPLSDKDRADAEAILTQANLSTRKFALLNPGGNNPAKRWPVECFAQLADHLSAHYNLSIAINGSPAETDLCQAIASACTPALHPTPPAVLPTLGITLGSLKSIVQRATLMVTNDTGPRHIAAAFATPLVSLFGPTDHRWTTIPTRPGAPESLVLADPTLPEDQVSNDHPDRCAITHITLERVKAAVAQVLTPPAQAPAPAPSNG